MAFNIFTLQAIKIFLSFFIPGFLVALPLLYKKRSIFEIPLWAAVFGIILPPMLTYLGTFVGIMYSYTLALASIALVSLAGLLLCVYEFMIKNEFRDSIKKFKLENPLTYIILYLIILSAFWVRAQSSDPYFYEFDPYYYDQVTQIILTEGYLPYTDTYAWAWYPNRDSHRNAALMNYLEASWYSIYTNGGAYDNILLAKLASFYPPLVGALIILFIFVILYDEYGRKYGIAGALLMAATPRIIEKLAGGENEQTPWGMFGTFFFYMAYYLMIKTKDIKYAVLAGLAFATTVMGSKSSLLVYLVMAGYIIYQATFDFLKKRTDKDFLKLNLIIFAFALVSQALIDYYLADKFVFSTDVFALAASLIYAGILYVLDAYVLKNEINLTGELGQLKKLVGERALFFIAFGILCSIVLMLTYPIDNQFSPGHIVIDYVARAAAFATPNSPLMKTVAEESPTGSDFEDALGPISFLSNFISLLTDNLVMKLFPTIPRTIALGLVLFVLMHISILIAYIKDSKSLLFFSIIFFPISYVGMNKSKFVLQHTFVAVMFLPVIFGEVEKMLFSNKPKEEKEKKEEDKFSFITLGNVFFAILLVLALWQYKNIPDIYLDQMQATVQTPGGGSYIDCNKLTSGTSRYLYCARIPDYWREPYVWVMKNVGKEDAILSWWDYGHWTNFFGQRKTITRNDHGVPQMDLEVADKFVNGTEEEMKQYMLEHKAKYVLMDVDLIGKWGALVYLSCTYHNKTLLANGQYTDPGQSKCDQDYYFERIYFPENPLPQEFCDMTDPDTGGFLVRALSSKLDSEGAQITYCLNPNQKILYLANGTAISPTFFDEGSTQQAINLGGLVQTRAYRTLSVIYTKSGSWDYRTGRGYDSNFYKGFFLGSLDGFELVYPQFPTALDPVRIYKIKE